MAIGNYYPVSGSVVDADLFLGTKAGSNNTVNYAAQTVVDYLNTNSKVSIGGQLSFKFVEVPNVPKTISFLGGGGNNTLFSSITQLIVSTSDLYGANITVFLNYLDGSEILLSQQNQPNFFGHYKITSYNQIGISAFYTLNLNFIGGNGNITKDTYYNMGSFILSSNLTVPTLNQVLTAGNTSLLDAKIGSLYLYDSTEFDYGYLSLNDSDFKFYDTFGPSVTMTRNAITLIGGIGGFNGTLSLPVITANRTYTLPNATGTIALTSDIPSLTGYVPYIGATGAVNLGDYDLTVNSITVGKGAGSILTNTAIGFEALKLNTTGQQNTALGYNSLRSVTTGGGNIGIGVNAGYLITTGVRNNFIGLAAGAGTTTGSNNTFMGDFVGRFNTTGSANTLLGKNAGFYFATGNDNTALGYESGYNNESGNRSVFAGYQSGYYAGSGGVYAISVSNSVLIGSNTRVSATPATNQIVIGDSAIGIGDNTVTLGNDSIVTTALKGNVGIGTTSPDRKLTISGTANAYMNFSPSSHRNFVLGSDNLGFILYDNLNAAYRMVVNFSGFVGIGTTNPTARLQINAQGALSTDIAFKIRNSADTRDFLIVNGTGDVYNNGAGGVSTSTVFGENSGRNSSAASNTFFGYFAGNSASSGGSNTAIGRDSLSLNTTGAANTSIGTFSLLSIIGTNNIGIGFNAGRYIADGATSLTTSGESIFIGNGSRANANGENNQIVIGHNAIGLGSNTVVLGSSSILTTALRGNVGIGTTAPAVRLSVQGSGSDTIRVGQTESVTGNKFLNIGMNVAGQYADISATSYAQSYLPVIINGAGGNVGIGTTTPGARLQVKAPGALSTDIAFKIRNSTDNADLFNINGLGNVGIGVGNPAGKLDLFDSASSSLYVRTGSVGANWATGTVLSQLGTYTDHPLVFKTNDTARMRIVNTTGNVLINTITDIPSSKLTVESTTQGFLPPRMTTVQRNAIASPATGLIVYDTDLLSEFQYNGTAWVTYQSQLNGTGFVKASGTTISYDNNTYAPIIVKDFVNSGVSGTNVNTIIRSYLIASNTFVLNDSLDILCSVFKNTTSQNVTLRVYFNTTVSLTGATLVGTYVLNPTTKFVNFQRTNIYAGSSFYCFPSAVSNITDRAVTNVDLSVVPFDNLVNNYIIFAIQLTSSLDAGYIGGIRITK